MDKAFWHYKPIDSTQEDGLWQDAVVSFDTNSLLHLYRYSPTARTEFLKALEHLRSTNRLWTAHQVGEEFFRNRPTVALEVRDNLSKTKDLIGQAEKQIKSIVK